MKLIDQHMHTDHSFDSKAKMEAYIVQTDGLIVTTEHLDFKDPARDFADNIPVYKDYVAEVNSLNALYDNRILKGIEVGWTHKDHQLTLDFLKDKKYDLVLLSVHQNGVFDYMDPEGFKDLGPEILIPQYLDALIQAVEYMHPYVNVLAHFEYGFRIHKISAHDLRTFGEASLRTLFASIIDKQIAFELNTSSMYKHKNISLYHYAITLYLEMGGTLFTLGSDAHFADHYMRNFEDAIQLLKQHHVKSLVCYIKQKPITVEL